MNDPASSDDDWNDLARELGVDKSAPRESPPEAPPADRVERLIEAEDVEPHHGMDERAEEEAVAEGEPETAVDEEFGDAEEGFLTEGAEQTAESLPGAGRKRRRRRRRRRKGGTAAEEAPTAEAAFGETAEEEEEGEVAMEPTVESEEFGTEEMETESVPVSVEEDTASEVLRDLIANWNVPSWDDIVSGLYRPG